MKKVNYKEFCFNPKYWIDRMQNDNNEVIIKCKEGKDLALIPFGEYNSLRESLYLLSGENRNVLLDSIHQLEPRIQVQKTLK